MTPDKFADPTTPEAPAGTQAVFEEVRETTHQPMQSTSWCRRWRRLGRVQPIVKDTQNPFFKSKSRTLPRSLRRLSQHFSKNGIAVNATAAREAQLRGRQNHPRPLLRASRYRRS